MARKKQVIKQQMIYLPTKDIIRAKAFYADVFDLDINTFTHQQSPNGEPWYLFPFTKKDSNSKDILTGFSFLGLTQDPQFNPSQEGVIAYLPCDDIDVTLARIEKYGGTVIQSKFPEPVMPPDMEIYYALFLDTEGNRVGLNFIAEYMDEATQTSASTLGGNGALVILTEENFTQQVQETQAQLVLMDFWAPWCGPCRTIAPHLEALATEFIGTVKIVKVNTDEQPALAKQYSIKSLPTLLLFDPKQGKEIARVVGAQGKESIKAFIKKQLTST